MANFETPLGVSAHVGSKLLLCINKFHKYCIDLRSNDLRSEIDEIIPIQTSPLGWGYIPTTETLQVPSVSETSQVCDAVLGMVS